MVVGELEIDQPLKGAERSLQLAEHQQRLAEAGERVLVSGIEIQGGVEGGTRPRVLLARKLGLADANVEIDCMGIASEPFAEQGERGVVTRFVVQLMGLFIVLIGATKRLSQG